MWTSMQKPEITGKHPDKRKKQQSIEYRKAKNTKYQNIS